jgi:hypothetical protein
MQLIKNQLKQPGTGVGRRELGDGMENRLEELFYDLEVLSANNVEFIGNKVFFGY